MNSQCNQTWTDSKLHVHATFHVCGVNSKQDLVFSGKFSTASRPSSQSPIRHKAVRTLQTLSTPSWHTLRLAALGCIVVLQVSAVWFDNG